MIKLFQQFGVDLLQRITPKWNGRLPAAKISGSFILQWAWEGQIWDNRSGPGWEPGPWFPLVWGPSFRWTGRYRISGTSILAASAEIMDQGAAKAGYLLRRNQRNRQTDWVVSMGQLMVLIDHPWLGIPASRKMSFLRYAEFLCVEKKRITRGAFFYDLIVIMNQ